MHHISAIGGGSYCLLNILKEIDRMSIFPIVALKCDGPLRFEIEKLGIEVIYFKEMMTIPYNKPLLRVSTLKNYLCVQKSLKNFDAFLKLYLGKIDIVYLNNMMLYPYLKTAKKMGLKTVMHVREHWPKNEHKYQMARARRYANHYVDCLVAINHFSASMFPECDKRTIIIYDSIDFSNRYEPRPFSEIFEEDVSKLKIFLFTGGGMQIKGALEVFRTFSNHLKGEEYRLLVLGEMPKPFHFIGIRMVWHGLLRLIGSEKDYYEELKAIVDRDERIKFIPATYKIVDIFQQAYCMLSFFTIPHANLALAEAVSLGTIVVSANTEEASEYSADGKGAILFEYGNEADFLTKIQYVEEHYFDVKAQVKSQAEAVKNLFDPDVNAEKLNGVLTSGLL